MNVYATEFIDTLEDVFAVLSSALNTIDLNSERETLDQLLFTSNIKCMESPYTVKFSDAIEDVRDILTYVLHKENINEGRESLEITLDLIEKVLN